MDSRTICAPDEDYRVTTHLEKENLEKSEFQSGQGKVREFHVVWKVVTLGESRRLHVDNPTIQFEVAY